MTGYNTYYEGYDETGDINLTKLHKHSKNALIEMLERLGMSEEEYYGNGVEQFCYVREVNI